MAQGRLLGNRYRLDSVVGRGGMGTVWRAHDTMLDREVAVKEVELPPGLTESEHAVLYERTLREARASARLNHPGVVTVHDVVEEAGRPWIVMELVTAPSLQDLLERGPVGHRRIAEIGLQMLGALRHAHEKGILHRDVKPSNVLITATGRVVLTDFGIAQMEGDSTLTQTGLVMGSPAYIPPERAAGERAVPASDLWGLGATIYAAVEGRSPYERPDAMASLQAALTEPVPPARNAGPLARVLEGLLAREPRVRMTAAQAQPLLTQVATMPEPRPPAPRPAPRPTPAPAPRPQQRPGPPGPPSQAGPPPSRPSVPAPPRTITDETVTDQPSSRFLPGPAPGPAPNPVSRPVDDETREDAAETILDPRVLDPHDPEATETDDDRRGEPRTLVETEWAPPPPPQPSPSAQRPSPSTSQPRPSVTPPPAPPPAPSPRQSAPPWGLPQSNWQQQPPPPVSRPSRSTPKARERRKTIIIVTVAAILVVAAVIAGALILRDRMGTGALDQARAEMPSPSIAAPSARTDGRSDTTSVITM
ncbi:serine/threonine-protein kinase [Actinomadura rifamycini]|uniref:serine/threonine-protein kinase n=1 Tax=Actinomadura rifamycini TaxID=31962 RepID=UPI0004181917|nr:serine/threonine-protein kinase [Actinomadura rifamycini]